MLEIRAGLAVQVQPYVGCCDRWCPVVLLQAAAVFFTYRDRIEVLFQLSN